LKESGLLDAFFALYSNLSRKDQIALLRGEIQDFLDGDTGFGSFKWL
jgi:hypothetical protein